MSAIKRFNCIANYFTSNQEPNTPLVGPIVHNLYIISKLHYFILEPSKQFKLTPFPRDCSATSSETINFYSMSTITAIQFIGCPDVGMPEKKFGIKVRKMKNDEEVPVYSGIRIQDILVSRFKDVNTKDILNMELNNTLLQNNDNDLTY